MKNMRMKFKDSTECGILRFWTEKLGNSMDLQLPGTPVAINMEDGIEEMDDDDVRTSSSSISIQSSRSGSRPSTGRDISPVPRNLTTPELIAESNKYASLPNSRPSTGRDGISNSESPEIPNASTDSIISAYSRSSTRGEIPSYHASPQPRSTVTSVSHSISNVQSRPSSGKQLLRRSPALPGQINGDHIASAESISEMSMHSSRPSTARSGAGGAPAPANSSLFITRSTPKLPKSGSRPSSARSVPLGVQSRTQSKVNLATISTPNLPRSFSRTTELNSPASSRPGTTARMTPNPPSSAQSPRPQSGVSTSSSSPRSTSSKDTEPPPASSRPPTVKAGAFGRISALMNKLPLGSRTTSQAWVDEKPNSPPTESRPGTSESRNSSNQQSRPGSSVGSSMGSQLSMSNNESVTEEDLQWRAKLRPNCFLPHLSEKYLCPACTNVLLYPVQLSNCEHLVCSSCLSEIMRGVMCCPVDRKSVDRSQVIVRRDFRKELNAKKLTCPQSDLGCQWIGTYDNFKNHYSSCEHAEISCPNGCGYRGQKRHMDDHIMKECSLRMVTCEFCTRAVRAEKEIDHLKQCPRFPVSCSNSCGKKQIPREELAKHIEEECPFGEIKCPFRKIGCYVTGTRDFVRRHIGEDLTNHMEMLCRGLDSATDRIAEHENSIDRLGAEIQEANHQVANLNKRQGCQLLWKIDNWSQRVVEANSGKKTILRSPPFYTGKYGYKLALTMMPNGDGKAKGSFLSLYACIVKGEYDALATWPFSMAITLTLIDQCQDPMAKVDHSYALRPNPCKENLPFLGRPTTNANPSFGAQSFAALDMLETRDYVREDVVFIKVLTEFET